MLTSRQHAVEHGLSRYFTGEPCKSGHIAERFTSTRQCVECSKLKAARYYKHNGGSTKAKYRHIENKYGLTQEQYDQGISDGCQICRTAFNCENMTAGDAPVVDHCHSGGQVRGFLCNNCNRGLGMFKDNTEFLRSAISYLESKH